MTPRVREHGRRSGVTRGRTRPGSVRACLAWLAAAGSSALAPGAVAADSGELLYVAEGNRLHRIDVDSIDDPPLLHEVLIERASRDPERGRDINGMVCALPDGSGRFVAGEDTGQPHPPAGWGVLEADGTQVGKLTASSGAGVPDPYGCAFDREGRLFGSDVGDPGFGAPNGQLLLWFPPFDRFPGPPGAYPQTDATSGNSCKLATDIGTAGALAIDARGRVYLASSSRFALYRFSPPFPTSPDAAGGCGSRDATGSPLADRVDREVFVRAPASFSGLAFARNGNLYAASVATGRIYEYDLDGNRVRTILEPPEWLPPFSTGYPQGLGVDSRGTLYYADLDLAWRGWMPGPGRNGKVRRIRFDADGEPLPPEIVIEGFAFPDAVSVLPGDL